MDEFITRSYEVGDTVEVSNWGGGTNIVVVETKEDDIKNGRPGGSGEHRWFYDDQIIRVVKRKEG